MSGGLEFPMQGVSQQLRVVVFALRCAQFVHWVVVELGAWRCNETAVIIIVTLIMNSKKVVFRHAR